MRSLRRHRTASSAASRDCDPFTSEKSNGPPRQSSAPPLSGPSGLAELRFDFKQRFGDPHNKGYANFESRLSVQPVKQRDLTEETQAWLEMVGRGELDLYTCLALSIGSGHLKQVAWVILPRTLAIMGLQLLLPFLMIRHQMKHFIFEPGVREIEFRIIGTLLFLYSTWNMHNNAHDECRSTFVDLCFKYNLSWRFVWPIILGELVNCFVAVELVLTLYSVFCSTIRVEDLLINTMSINFIGSIDNDFVSPEMQEVAKKEFTVSVQETIESLDDGHMQDDEWRKSMEKSLEKLVLYSRRIGITVLGCVLACIFGVANEAWFCEHAYWIHMHTPFCEEFHD